MKHVQKSVKKKFEGFFMVWKTQKSNIFHHWLNGIEAVKSQNNAFT